MEQVLCKSHPQNEAKWECESCGNFFCDECIRIHRISNEDFQICKECGGKCNSFTKSKPAADEDARGLTFFEQLPSAFAYPFREGAIGSFIIGVIFFSVLNFVAAFSLFGLFIAFFVAGYLFAWFIDIIHTTVNGEDTLAGWPDFRDFWSDIVHPYFLMIGTAVLCQLPAGLCFLGFIFIGGPAKFIFLLLGIPLSFLGSIYLPMGVLAVVIFGTLTALSPSLIIPSIGKVIGPYAVVCLTLFLLMGINVAGRIIGSFIPIIGPVIAYAVGFYLMIIEARILGLLYRTNEKRLEWLTVE